MTEAIWLVNYREHFCYVEMYQPYRYSTYYINLRDEGRHKIRYSQ